MQEKAETSMDESDLAAAETLAWPIAWLVRLRAFDALRYREYRLLWYGQVFASMGTWMDQVTRGWLIYELTNSALHLGLVRGIQAIPFLLLSPIAGSTADRYSRKFQGVGPALSGVLISFWGTGFSYAVQAIFFLLATIWTMQMSSARYRSTGAHHGESFTQSIL